MASKISFVKMSGAGNDFIVVDNRKGLISKRAQMAVLWCDRKNSIGGDGLLLLEKSKKASATKASADPSAGGNFRMRIFNSDGSEAEMCGNGIRCIGKFAYDKKITRKTFKIETIAGIIDVQIKGEIVKARMIDPHDMKLNFNILLNHKSTPFSFVNTGVPHAVQFVNSLKDIDVENTGRQVRTHEHFKPRGANANFIQMGSGNTIEIRTYERGVEGETLACGTGSTAGALVAAATHRLKSPVSVKTKSGEILKIYFSKDGDRFHDVHLEGAVKKCFEGRV